MPGPSQPRPLYSEHTLLERNNVRITPQRVTFAGRTIPLDTITSVTLARSPARRSVGYTLLMGGCLLLLAGAWQLRDALLIGGGVLIALGLVLALLPRDRFHLLLGSNSGEVEALVSTRRELMENVTSVLHNAIVQDAIVQDAIIQGTVESGASVNGKTGKGNTV